MGRDRGLDDAKQRFAQMMDNAESDYYALYKGLGRSEIHGCGQSDQSYEKCSRQADMRGYYDQWGSADIEGGKKLLLYQARDNRVFIGALI